MNTTKVVLMLSLTALLPVWLPTAAQAHITLETKTVEAGSWAKLVLRVPEGCDGSPTTAIKVDMGKDFFLPRPMPKAGWKLDVTREKLDKPIKAHAVDITEGIRTATWSGSRLPDEYYDEFIVFTRVPLTPGKYPVKVTQVCEKGSIDWHEVAKPGQSRRELKAPAPELDVLPKPPAKP